MVCNVRFDDEEAKSEDKSASMLLLTLAACPPLIQGYLRPSSNEIHGQIVIIMQPYPSPFSNARGENITF